MRTRVPPTFEDRRLSSITVTDIKAWVAALVEAELAASTIRKCYQLVSQVMGEAVEAGIMAASPCRRVALPSLERAEPAVLLSPEQVDRVNFLRRRIDIAEILIEVDGDLSFGPPKTKASRMTLSLPLPVVELLSAQIAAYADPDTTRGLIFTTKDGAPLRRSNFGRRVWRPAVTKAKLPARVTFYDLRHATASWLIHAGANPLEVAEKMRHAKVATTLGVYGHLFPSTDERLDGLLEATFVEARADEPRTTRGLTGLVTRSSEGRKPR